MSDKRTSIDIREDADDMWKLEFPYEEDFVALLKTIPHRERGYDSATKSWFVHDRHLDMVVDGAKKLFDRVTKIFRREGTVVWLDCNTGVERVQTELFNADN